jgi:hypothetical protein
MASSRPQIVKAQVIKSIHRKQLTMDERADL